MRDGHDPSGAERDTAPRSPAARVAGSGGTHPGSAGRRHGGPPPRVPPVRHPSRVERVFTAFETWTPVVLLIVAAVMGLATIVLRYGFGIGFAWAQGVLVLIAVLSAFLACSGAVRTDEHIRFDLILRQLGPRWRPVGKAAVDLIVIAFLGLLLVLIARFARFQFRFGGTSLDTYLPEWIQSAGIGLAIAMMTVRYLQRLVAAILEARRALDRGTAP